MVSLESSAMQQLSSTLDNYSLPARGTLVLEGSLVGSVASLPRLRCLVIWCLWFDLKEAQTLQATKLLATSKHSQEPVIENRRALLCISNP